MSILEILMHLVALFILYIFYNRFKKLHFDLKVLLCYYLVFYVIFILIKYLDSLTKPLF